MISSVINSTSVQYSYDHNNIRTTKGNNTTTTTYPNMYYSVTSANTTKHIYNPVTGELLATIEGDGSATSTQYIHTDHLGGTNVVTNQEGEVVETTDYYPFGEQRVATGSFDEQRKFTGHEFDSDTDLTYAKQRYYDQDVGKFISQDSAFLSVGTSKLADIMKIEKKDSKDENDRRLKALQQYLSDPQQMNSYSYANNNPVNLKDLEGEFVQLTVPVILQASLRLYGFAQTIIDLYEAKTVLVDYPEQFTEKQKQQTKFNTGLNLLIGGVSSIGSKVEQLTLDISSVILDAFRNYPIDNIKQKDQQSIDNNSNRIDRKENNNNNN